MSENRDYLRYNCFKEITTISDSSDYVLRRWEWWCNNIECIAIQDFIYCAVLSIPYSMDQYFSLTFAALNQFLSVLTKKHMRAIWIMEHAGTSWSKNDVNIRFHIMFTREDQYFDYSVASVFVDSLKRDLYRKWRTILGKHKRVGIGNKLFEIKFPFRPPEFFDESDKVYPIRTVEMYLGTLLSLQNEKMIRLRWNLPTGFDIPITFGGDLQILRALGFNQFRYPPNVDDITLETNFEKFFENNRMVPTPTGGWNVE